MDKRLLNPESTLIRMRPLTESDIPFVFEIRRSERSTMMNPTSPDIAEQYSYFEKYLDRLNNGDEIYYMIHDKKLNLDIGVVRLTEIRREKVFGWESLILKSESTPGCFLDISASIYAMGFEWLEKEECGPWVVMKSNERVMKVHEVIDIARKVDEDDLRWFVSAKKSNFEVKIEKLRRRGFGRIHDY